MSKTYCVASAIIKNSDKYFIAKRADSKKFAPGHWEFISGFIEDHEAAEDTILKELREEINAEGRIEKVLDIYQFGDEHGRWIVVPFVISVKDSNIQTNPAEHSEGRWVAWEELEQMPGEDLQEQVRALKTRL
ncbi:MAG: NUDIX hydrolase [Candidatus Saccharimonadales bacterium]|jgi:mutator protein MutT